MRKTKLQFMGPFALREFQKHLPTKRYNSIPALQAKSAVGIDTQWSDNEDDFRKTVALACKELASECITRKVSAFAKTPVPTLPFEGDTCVIATDNESNVCIRLIKSFVLLGEVPIVRIDVLGA